jgi:hypothetical protein
MRLDFLLLFGVYAVVLGNPETQTVSHSFPKLCAALQRKCGIEIEPVSAWFESLMRLRLIDQGAAVL